MTPGLEKALKRFKRNGNKVKDAKKEIISAKAVNKPNNTVGVKLERAKIETQQLLLLLYKKPLCQLNHESLRFFDHW